MTPPDDAGHAAHSPSACRAEEARRRYAAVRAASERLAEPLSPEDQTAQSMPDASPVKWHLAHTSWFFETFLLTPRVAGYEAFDPRYGYLFNSYYEALGARQPRPARGLLTRPSAQEVLAFRAHVDRAMTDLLAGESDDALLDLVDLGLAHEEQHQELILMDILHLFAQSPLAPAYAPTRTQPMAVDPGPAAFAPYAGGLVEIGHGGEAFAFDNESPRHRVFVEPFALADRLVTNAEWLAFMADDGYGRAEFWLSDGWARVQAEGWRAPLYWREADGGWQMMTLQGLRPVDPHAPVLHVSYYEADAFAAWAGARLPSEAEWEHAAERGPPPPAAESGSGVRLAPRPAAGGERGLRQMFGEAWAWTRSAYGPHPGFAPAPGAVGEYNGKFMSGQMVLRGGCFATPPAHVRTSYRNFFYPHQRWMFSGVRLAKDGDAKVIRARPRQSGFALDVIEGLSRTRKELPPKYFYDAQGSRLFEAICELPEYYPTRTEIALLRQAAGEIASAIPDGAVLVEFGSGASVKTRLLLDAAPQVAVYTPIDISRDALEAAAAAIRADYPDVVVAALVDDFTTALNLPAEVAGRPHFGFFPGSTIGNFPPRDAAAFLERARHLLGQGAKLLVGIDLVKNPVTLVAAYDDAQGVTAAFNLNLLARINRELGGDFDLAAFRHQALWNADESRIEMHLVSMREQTVRAAGQSFDFAVGESIHTENSYKFTVDGFASLAAQAGWKTGRSWISPAPTFAAVLLET